MKAETVAEGFRLCSNERTGMSCANTADVQPSASKHVTTFKRAMSISMSMTMCQFIQRIASKPLMRK